MPEEMTGIEDRVAICRGAPAGQPGPGARVGRGFVFRAEVAGGVPVVAQDAAVEQFSGFRVTVPIAPSSHL